jgi:hypothetical protein
VLRPNRRGGRLSRVQKAKVGMKVLSSLVLGVGLLLPGALVLAADAPAAGGATKAASGAKPASANPARKGAAAAPQKAEAAAPAAPAIPLEVDGVTFGMSADDVAKLYDRWWDKQFVPKYQKANPGPKTRELDFDLAEKKKVLRRVATFDGRSTSFDKSEFHEEFAHGNGETMTSAKVSRKPTGDAKDAKPTTYTRRFFFFQDKLWKTYDEYKLGESSPFGADFKVATQRVESSLGKAAKKTRGPESQLENVTYDAGDTRVRVVKLPSDKIAIVRSDNALAKAVLDGRAQQAKAGEAADLDDDIQAVIR